MSCFNWKENVSCAILIPKVSAAASLMEMALALVSRLWLLSFMISKSSSIGGFSSFYPKSMSPQEVIGSINEAYRNRVYIRGNTYSGLTSSGMEIEMFLDKNGKIISAYPVY